MKGTIGFLRRFIKTYQVFFSLTRPDFNINNGLYSFSGSFSFFSDIQA